MREKCSVENKGTPWVVCNAASLHTCSHTIKVPAKKKKKICKKVKQISKYYILR